MDARQSSEVDGYSFVSVEFEAVCLSPRREASQ